MTHFMFLILICFTSSAMISADDGWIAVSKDKNYDFDLAKTSVEVKTDSKLGSNEVVDMWLLKGQGNGFSDMAGSVMLNFASTMQYRFGLCNGVWSDFPSSSKIPSAPEKVWRITMTRTPDVRMQIYCNDDEVLDVTLSSNTCADNGWDTSWNYELTKILFTKSMDTASDYYRPYTETPKKDEDKTKFSFANCLKVNAALLVVLITAALLI